MKTAYLNLSLRKKIITTAVIGTLLMGAGTAVGLHGLYQTDARFANFVEKDMKEVQLYNAMLATGFQSAMAVRNIVIDPQDATAVENHAKAHKDFMKVYEAARDMAVSAQTKAAIGRIGESFQKLETGQNTLIALSKADPKAAQARLVANKSANWRVLKDEIKKELAHQIQQSTDIEAEIQAQTRASLILAIGLVLMGMLATLAMFGLMTRDLDRRAKTLVTHLETAARTRDLTQALPAMGEDELGRIARALNSLVESVRGALQQVSTAANHSNTLVGTLAERADSVSNNAKTQFEGVMQVSTAMEEMSATVQEVARNANQAAAAAGTASSVVSKGNAVGQQTGGALKRIDASVRSSAETIQDLESAIQRIGEMTHVIKDIADQTNLLALNAAIEAARAGEHGRGFAVVADEVRKLSERTATSTTDIVQIVQTVQASTALAVSAMQQARDDVNQGVSHGDEMTRALGEIDRAVQQVTSMMQQIATAAEEQSAVGADIARNLNRVAEVTDVTSRDVTETHKAVQDLQGATNSLSAAVQQFRS